MSKAILFDLDGTLTDSSEGIMKCCRYAMENYNITLSDEQLRAFIGPPLRLVFAENSVPESEVEAALARYRERYCTIGKYENRPYDGIDKLLKRLVVAGHRLFVATSKPEALSVDIVEHFSLRKYFIDVCGATFDKSRDSKEKVIEYLLSKHNLSGEIIMVGDTVFDVEGAAKCGIPTVGVSWGFGEKKKLLEAGALTVVDTMDELFEVLDK